MKGADGTNSGTFGPAKRSFKVSKASLITSILYNTKANEGKFAQAHIFDKFVVQCPKNCSKIKHFTLIGTKIYTDNSFICIAAIHMGIINDLGGEVTFKLELGKNHYKGSNGFGIVSKTYGPHVRSFQFLGLRAAIHFHYVEHYKGDLKNNWKIIVDRTPRFISSNRWDFIDKHNFKNALGHEERVIGIQHLGLINSYGKNKYGAWIILKDQEWANGSVYFNLLLIDKNQVAFFFRYKDSNNYYSIKIDPLKAAGNIKLIARINCILSTKN